MLRGVRIRVVLSSMLHWAVCGSSVSAAIIFIPAYLLASEELVGLAFLVGFVMGLDLGFWIGIVREVKRLVREGTEAPR